MPGPGRMRGPAPKVQNPGKLLGRLLAYVGKRYLIQCIVVVVCIFIGVLANVQGPMFMRDLIDSYIMPMIGQTDPDFGPLLANPMSTITRAEAITILGRTQARGFTANDLTFDDAGQVPSWALF